MKHSLTFTPLLFLSASGAVAADMLPLTRGIYVVAGTPCNGASNVDTLSYWGGNNGINSQRTDRRIVALSGKSPTYRLRRACTELREGGAFPDRVEIVIRNPKSFTIRAWPGFAGDARTFRYCAPKV